jgi:hypothetical protein
VESKLGEHFSVDDQLLSESPIRPRPLQREEGKALRKAALGG